MKKFTENFIKLWFFIGLIVTLNCSSFGDYKQISPKGEYVLHIRENIDENRMRRTIIDVQSDGRFIFQNKEISNGDEYDSSFLETFSQSSWITDEIFEFKQDEDWTQYLKINIRNNSSKEIESLYFLTTNNRFLIFDLKVNETIVITCGGNSDPSFMGEVTFEDMSKINIDKQFFYKEHSFDKEMSIEISNDSYKIE